MKLLLVSTPALPIQLISMLHVSEVLVDSSPKDVDMHVESNSLSWLYLYIMYIALNFGGWSHAVIELFYSMVLVMVMNTCLDYLCIFILDCTVCYAVVLCTGCYAVVHCCGCDEAAL